MEELLKHAMWQVTTLKMMPMAGAGSIVARQIQSQEMGDVYAPVTQASMARSSEIIENKLDDLRDQIREEQIELTKREDISRNINDLKDEISKENPQLGKIQELFEWFKKNTPYLLNVIKPIIQDIITLLLQRMGILL